jgi:hypothetical protein
MENNNITQAREQVLAAAGSAVALQLLMSEAGMLEDSQGAALLKMLHEQIQAALKLLS